MMRLIEALLRAITMVVWAIVILLALDSLIRHAHAGTIFAGAFDIPLRASEVNAVITICQQEPVSRRWSCFMQTRG